MDGNTLYFSHQPSVYPLLITILFLTLAAIASNPKIVLQWRNDYRTAKRDAEARTNKTVRKYPWMNK